MLCAINLFAGCTVLIAGFALRNGWVLFLALLIICISCAFAIIANRQLAAMRRQPQYAFTKAEFDKLVKNAARGQVIVYDEAALLTSPKLHEEGKQ